MQPLGGDVPVSLCGRVIAEGQAPAPWLFAPARIEKSNSGSLQGCKQSKSKWDAA